MVMYRDTYRDAALRGWLLKPYLWLTVHGRFTWNKKSALSMAIIDGHIQVVDDLIKAKRCNTFVSTRGAGRCAS
eukprot:1185676-Prorocentrum_minimum.AAC.2